MPLNACRHQIIGAAGGSADITRSRAAVTMPKGDHWRLSRREGRPALDRLFLSAPHPSRDRRRRPVLGFLGTRSKLLTQRGQRVRPADRSVMVSDLIAGTP